MEANLLSSGRVQFAEPVPEDGSVQAFSINNDGRLRVASKAGNFPSSVAPLTTLGQQLAVDVADASNVVIHAKNTGTATMAAGAFIFEGSLDSIDGVDGTWFGLQAIRSNANTIETSSGTLALGVGVGTAWAWELSVNAVKWFRIRCTTATTLNSIATWTVVRGSYATEPIPAAQTHAVTLASTTVTSNTPAAGTAYALTTAATTNAALIKTATTGLYEITAFNTSAATVFVKLFNKATVAPIPGTDVPVMTIPVAAGAMANIEFGALGKRFPLGLGIAVTATGGALDATAVAAGIQIHATYI